MSEERPVISFRNLPIQPFRFIWTGLILWLLLDRFGAGQIAHAITWTAFALMFLSIIIAWFSQREIDIFSSDRIEQIHRARSHV